MIEAEFKQLVQEHHTEKYGLVVPGFDNINLSANGLYYTAIFNQLMKSNNYKVDFSYGDKVKSCFKEPGLPMRNPENSGGQEQFDNFVGITLGCQLTNRPDILRSILWYSVTHFFVFNTDDKLEFKDWIGRYPHVWLFMTASAIPLSKYLLYLPLLAIVKTFKPSPSDMSGNLLQYVFISIFRDLYGNNSVMNKWTEMVNNTVEEGVCGMFKKYFSQEHAFSRLVQENGKF